MQIDSDQQDQNSDSDADVLELLGVKSEVVAQPKHKKTDQELHVKQMGQSEVLLILNQKGS